MEIEEIILESWENIVELEPEAGGWIYRGHSNENWEIETSLSRVIELNKFIYPNEGCLEDKMYAERAGLKTFKSRAHFYLDYLPETLDSLSWLSLMQHHGTPTRLLDFTKSFYVAMYFALIETKIDSCIWAIDEMWMIEEGAYLASKNGFKTDHILRHGKLETIYNFANYIINKNDFEFQNNYNENLGVLLIEVKRQIPRLAVQQGVFLAPTSLKKSFMENLEQMNKKGKIKKIIIPISVRNGFLMHLRAMNITAESLFPGIDGFAKSLIHHDML